MAALAMHYYDSLQTDGLDDEPANRDDIIRKVLMASTTRLSSESRNKLDVRLTVEDVERALQTSGYGKAAGLDGLPYELWRQLHKEFEKRTKLSRGDRFESTRPLFNVIAVLTAVFNDIGDYGVAQGTNFAEGWIYPLFKKGDRRNIANYRPITLLNTDYKLLTKALALKLNDHVPHIIHPDQAGFIPGRHIYNQTRLAQDILEYDEAAEENGAIVALDQEKAYDKISHDYLWAVLSHFGLPDRFVRTIRSLYENAESLVMVNGVPSDRFKVTRGVRQGDPLSCLLFVIAIEPLACLLRSSRLHGFKIPGVPEWLVTTLFADDTTVYLSERDDYHEMWAILDLWCAAARARFNGSKTQIIPVGSLAYCYQVVESRRLTATGAPLPDNVVIADCREGHSIRILGAWVGYNISPSANPWSLMLDKIHDDLARWERCKPSVFGRKIIVEWVIGGRTQYLTKVQGMPTDVKQVLLDWIRSFMAKGKHPVISLDAMYQPAENGGLGLLDLNSRVEAIELTWLKPYTDLTPGRPLWCFVEDFLIAQSVRSILPEAKTMACMNVFLQTWKPTAKDLPDHITRMLRLAAKYQVSFGALKLPASLKAQLPAWYHISNLEPLRRLNNTQRSQCLRQNHGAKTVGDLLQLSQYRLENPDPRRSCARRRNCACANCKRERELYQCQHPTKCLDLAQRIVQSLGAKWNLLDRTSPDGLSLTRRRTAANARVLQFLNRPARTVGTRRAGGILDDGENENRGVQKVLFDPSITSREDEGLKAVFQIFTDPGTRDVIPGCRLRGGTSVPNAAITVYTDGACENNGYDDARAGAAAWYGIDDPRNIAFRITGVPQSNQRGELYAVLQTALKERGLFAPLTIVTDSLYVINGLTLNMRKYERNGWIGVSNRDLFRAILAALRKRGAPTYFQWVKGHDGNFGNNQADQAAQSASRLEEPLELQPFEDPRYLLSGLQISTMTQKLLYRGIRERSKPIERRTTQRNLDIVRHAVREVTGHPPTDAAIWRGIRTSTLPPNIREFYWKAFHGAHRTGSYWLKFTHFEHRALCEHCQVPDDLEHILLECAVSGYRTVWHLAESVWRRTGKPWTQMSLGLALGCALVKFHRDESHQRPDKGLSRLYLILISESVYLLWKLRCERVLQRAGQPESWHHVKEVEARWWSAINRRLRMDQVMTHPRYGKKALKKRLVLRT